jgi:hypothetical protein
VASLARFFSLLPFTPLGPGAGKTIDNPGNVQLRSCAKMHSPAYKACPNKEKRKFIEDLVRQFSNETRPPRRFLGRFARNDGLWRDATKDKVYGMVQRLLNREWKGDEENKVGEEDVIEQEQQPHEEVKHRRAQAGRRRKAGGRCDQGSACSFGGSSSALQQRPSTNIKGNQSVAGSTSTVTPKPKKQRVSVAAQGDESNSLNENDVMCRGGIHRGAGIYSGNTQVFELLDARRHDLETEGYDERLLARSVVQQIRNMDPPGRFLKESERGKFYHVGKGVWYA